MKTEIKDDAQERLSILAKIALTLVCDSLLLLIWLPIAWFSEIAEHYFVTQGLSDKSCVIFHYVSLYGILALASLYIIYDVVHTAKKLYGQLK